MKHWNISPPKRRYVDNNAFRRYDWAKQAVSESAQINHKFTEFVAFIFRASLDPASPIGRCLDDEMRTRYRIAYDSLRNRGLYVPSTWEEYKRTPR